VVLRGHKTSISVEDASWNSVKEIAGSGQMSVSELLSAIDSERHHGNLSSAIRLFVLNFYREQLLERLDTRDKRKAIQWLISSTGRTASRRASAEVVKITDFPQSGCGGFRYRPVRKFGRIVLGFLDERTAHRGLPMLHRSSLRLECIDAF
jgi:predicted DNA-binding ribbon-helix-helix protein